MSWISAIAACSMLSFAGLAHADAGDRKLSKEERRAMALTPEQAATKIEITGTGDLDPLAWVSTKPFLESEDDKFLRAVIDKESGQVVYQLYLLSSTRAPLRIRKMTYAIDGELRSVPVERIFFDVSCQRYGCTYYEEAIAVLPRNDLEALAEGLGAPGAGGASWRMRLFGDLAEGIDTQLLRNETRGFLIAVDREAQRFAAP